MRKSKQGGREEAEEEVPRPRAACCTAIPHVLRCSLLPRRLPVLRESILFSCRQQPWQTRVDTSKRMPPLLVGVNVFGTRKPERTARTASTSRSQ